jgi:hypothetical protein
MSWRAPDITRVFCTFVLSDLAFCPRKLSEFYTPGECRERVEPPRSEDEEGKV